MEPVIVLAIVACVTFALGTVCGHGVGHAKGRLNGTLTGFHEGRIAGLRFAINTLKSTRLAATALNEIRAEEIRERDRDGND